MLLNVKFDYDNGFGGIYPATAVVEYKPLAGTYDCREWDADGPNGGELRPTECNEVVELAEELAYLKVRKVLTYGRRIALLSTLGILVSLLIGAKSLPVWTVVGTCSWSPNGFVVWVEAENASLALLEAAKPKQTPIEVFEGKHRGLLSGGNCD